MDKHSLLVDLKQLRDKYKFTRLDTIINDLGRELIQESCKHPEKDEEKGSCYYGSFTRTWCKVCKLTLTFDKSW